MYMQVLIISVLCVLVHHGDAVLYGSVKVVPNTPVGEKLFFLPYINGSEIPIQNISYINFNGTINYDSYRALLTLSDFPELIEVRLDKMSLRRLPHFSNVPKLDTISAYGNSLQHIAKEWFGDTAVEILILDENSIRKIDDGSFGEMMTLVDLACNELTEISAKWFRRPSRMELFSLKYNKITTLPANLLRGFTNLSDLDLSYNQIVTVGTAALTGPRSLDMLNLSVNRISELPAKVIQNKRHYFPILNLSYNRLNFLEVALLSKLDVIVLHIYGNPWQCSCLHQIEHWILEKGVRNRPLLNTSDPICISPLSYADKCIQVVDKELYRSYVKSLTPPPQPFCSIIS